MSEDGNAISAAGIILDVIEEGVLKGGGDYFLKEGESLWISVGNASVNIQHGSDGVGVVLYPLHREDEDSVAETWATWGEFGEASKNASE